MVIPPALDGLWAGQPQGLKPSFRGQLMSRLKP
jgi:hypothetical protein